MSSLYFGEEKPPLSEVVEHYGVKGMKWGVRRNQAALDRAAGRKRTTIKERVDKSRAKTIETKDARARVASKERQLNRQVDVVNLAEAGKKQADEYLKLEKMSVDFMKDPDRSTALRLTAGEKAAVAAIAALPGPGTATAVGMLAVNAGQKSMVKKQRQRAGG
jgi:hypothetical protein